MKECKYCNLYIDEESSFCPYCGKKLWKAVQQVELDAATQKLTVKSEVYKYKEEKRNRYVFYTSKQDKISSFIPDFSAEIKDAWLIGDDRIIIVTRQQEIVKLRILGINKKACKEICKLPFGNYVGSSKLYTTEDGRLLLSVEKYSYGKTDFCLINGNEILTYSVEANVFDVELYSDDSIVCNQGGKEVYLLTSDGTVQTVSSLYDKEELLRRYHMQCIEADRFLHPEIIWNLPCIESQTLDRNSGEISVSLCCGGTKRNGIFKYCHEDTLIVEPDEDLPIEQIPPVVMEDSEWEKEAADIRHMEELMKKDNPEWKVHVRLYAFFNIAKNFLYGTGEQEQFIYDRKNRLVFFLPLGQHGREEEVLEFAIKYAEKNPDKFLLAQKLEQMHLLDSVTEKLIRTHEARLQPFFQYMKDEWQYDSMVKGEKGFRNITYPVGKFLDAVDMVIGVECRNESGEVLVGWKEQEAMYTERATGMIVRMNTPYGKKVVDISFGTEPLAVVRMTDDQPANNRSEWYTALKGQWKRCPRKKIPRVPIPYSTINVCSDAVNRVEMSKYHLYSDDYRLRERLDITRTDLYYSPDGYKLKPDESVGSFYYRLDDNVKVAVDDLTDIHLYALNKDGIFYIKNHHLYFHGRNNERRNYDGEYYDSVRLLVSNNYIFIDRVYNYERGNSYDAYGDTVYLTEFSVKYQTNVISRATGECVAVWKDMPEITQLYQWDDHIITIATGDTWYKIADSDEGIQSLSVSCDRQKKGKQVLTKENMGEKAYALIEQYGIKNYVGTKNDGTVRMIVDGSYKDFS